MPALAGGTDQAFLTYRVGGQGFNTGQPIESVRNGEWHHIVATKNGSSVALYVDGTQVHTATNATDSDPAASPWHVMRNGTNDTYAAGEADELALYTRALSPAEVNAHYDLANDLADDPLPSNPPNTGTDPPAGEPPAGGPGGGASPPRRPAPRPARRSGPVRVRRGTLIARGAPGVRNNLIVRRRGRNWIVRDRLAAPARRRRLQAPERARRELPRRGREAHRPLRRRGQRPPDGDRPHPRELPRRPRPRRDPARPLAARRQNLPSRCSSSPSTRDRAALAQVADHVPVHG